MAPRSRRPGERPIGRRSKGPSPDGTSTFAALTFCVLALAPTKLSAEGPSEYALKSVFLYNFCRFIEWPSSAFSAPDEPFTIGIVGDDPFGPLLNEAIAGENYHGRPIRI